MSSDFWIGLITGIGSFLAVCTLLCWLLLRDDPHPAEIEDIGPRPFSPPPPTPSSTAYASYKELRNRVETEHMSMRVTLSDFKRQVQELQDQLKEAQISRAVESVIKEHTVSED